MKPSNISGGILVLCVLAAGLGCAWVTLTPEGSGVRILQASQVAGCEKLGQVSSKTTDRIAIFARTERKVREEVTYLARNDAAEMGGDAIVPAGPLAGGRQSFDAYRCGAR
jgi:hypothetical protein